jgi:hypothetical protein
VVLTLFEKILIWVRSVWALKTPIPNQGIIEEPGKAMGLTDEDNEPLQASEKIEAEINLGGNSTRLHRKVLTNE